MPVFSTFPFLSFTFDAFPSEDACRTPLRYLGMDNLIPLCIVDLEDQKSPCEVALIGVVHIGACKI